jgi:hypothetical protein
MRLMWPRLLGCALLLGWSGTALANGAMGLGLEMFQSSYWYVYVATMVGLEAWLIGRWFGVSWLRSLVVAAGANAFTGLLCGMGAIAPFLHSSFVGTGLEPRPLPNAVALLAIFAIPSAVLEAFVWHFGGGLAKERRLLGRVILVHVVTIPVALAILLVPARPYLGLESQSYYSRRMEIARLGKALERYARTHEELPEAATALELLQAVSPLSYPPLQPAAVFVPQFGRFDLRETRRVPWELNPELSGAPLEYGDETRWVWVLRPPPGFFANDRWLWIDPASGECRLNRQNPGL